MLVENTLFGSRDKVKESLAILRSIESDRIPYLGFSGGKDSLVVKQLAIEAGIEFKPTYTPTNIDPPEVIRYINKYHPDVKISTPQKTFWYWVIKKGLPSRAVPWCCDKMKKRLGRKGDATITGVRWEESATRNGRPIFSEFKGQLKINPIAFWTTADVWDFIESRNLHYCQLYDEGWDRIGCIMCPKASAKQMQMQAKRWPGYRKLFEIFSDKRIQYLREKGKATHWETGKKMVDWWLSGKPLAKRCKDQTRLFE